MKLGGVTKKKTEALAQIGISILVHVKQLNGDSENIKQKLSTIPKDRGCKIKWLVRKYLKQCSINVKH